MDTNPLSSAQSHLIQHLKECLPSNISLAEELSDLLEISNDSAYRRIRGETALSIDEAAIICKHFNLSFDAFIRNNDAGYVSFSYHRLNSGADSYLTYLKNVLSDLKKILSFENKQIIYAAEDIPVFYQFHHPELAAFKMFYWQKSILTLPKFENKQFDKSIISQEFIDLSKEILDCYAQIPSVEIWSDETVNSTLKQIEFYWESGVLKSKEDALAICTHVEKMFDNVCKQAESNRKLQSIGGDLSDNYALYHSDIMIGTNCILADMNGLRATYLSYHTFNTMHTTNANFCNETDLWLNNLLKKSNLISGVAEKQRYKFFKRISDQMDRLKQKIESES